MRWAIAGSCLMAASAAFDATEDSATAATMPCLSDTGQTTHYSQTFGEDSDFSGSGPSYLDIPGLRRSVLGANGLSISAASAAIPSLAPGRD